MPFDETLAGRIRRVLARRRNVEEKKMFGGLGFLLKGNMCCGVWKEFLILRLGPEQTEAALRDQHVKPFDITGKAMSGWVMVAPDGTKDDTKLADWIRQAFAFVSKLPAK